MIVRKDLYDPHMMRAEVGVTLASFFWTFYQEKLLLLATI